METICTFIVKIPIAQIWDKKGLYRFISSVHTNSNVIFTLANTCIYLKELYFTIISPVSFSTHMNKGDLVLANMTRDGDDDCADGSDDYQGKFV